jgi:hypothetical protein
VNKIIPSVCSFQHICKCYRNEPHGGSQTANKKIGRFEQYASCSHFFKPEKSNTGGAYSSHKKRVVNYSKEDRVKALENEAKTFNSEITELKVKLDASDVNQTGAPSGKVPRGLSEVISGKFNHLLLISFLKRVLKRK